MECNYLLDFITGILQALFQTPSNFDAQHSIIQMMPRTQSAVYTTFTPPPSLQAICIIYSENYGEGALAGDSLLWEQQMNLFCANEISMQIAS